MSEKDFLYVSPLDEQGNFEIPLPMHAPRRSLIVDVKNLHTYFPIPELKTDDEDEGFNVENGYLQTVKKLTFDPNELFSEFYGSRSFFEVLQSEDSVSEFFNKMYDSKNDPIKMFKGSGLNRLFEEMREFDVVLFVEYGLYLNSSARIKGVRASRGTNASRSYAFQNAECNVYGFKAGFSFNSVLTFPDASNSFFWNKFSTEVLTSKTDYGIHDMIAYAVLDTGGMEFLKFPDQTSMIIRREGYGFLIYFESMDTFLSCTVTSGRLPFVLEENYSLVLPDGDFENLEISQEVCFLRYTDSRLVPLDNEYKVRMNLIERKVVEKRKDKEPFVKIDDMSSYKFSAPVDFLFDCPFVVKPLWDADKGGFSVFLPCYGGFGFLYLIYFFVIFYRCFEPEHGMHFVTATSLINFACGTIFDYEKMHGMFSWNVVENPSDVKKMYEGALYNAVNPLRLGFFRLIYMFVYRDRSVSEKIADSSFSTVFILGLKVQFGGEKYILSKKNFYSYPLVQTYPHFLEEFNGQTMDDWGHLVYPVSSRKPILINEPFSFVYSPNTTVVLPNAVKFQFVRFDEKGNVHDVEFSKGDKIMMKGTFRFIS